MHSFLDNIVIIYWTSILDMSPGYPLGWHIFSMFY